MSQRLLFCTIACIVLLPSFTLAQTITWAGRNWRVTNGRMAGIAPGDPANVKVDANGYLQLHIVEREGKWTAAELFTVDKLGFGTYQWIVEGDVYNMDKSTVLGLFPYGPVHHIGTDAENEIDIEFSQWNDTCHGCNADFTVYPSTGNHKPKGASSWEDNFRASGGNITTARMDWTFERIIFTLMNGSHTIGTTADVIKTETYTSNPTNIPQVPMPVGINLWCFKTPPAKNQSVVIREFQFKPQ